MRALLSARLAAIALAIVLVVGLLFAGAPLASGAAGSLLGFLRIGLGVGVVIALARYVARTELGGTAARLAACAFGCACVMDLGPTVLIADLLATPFGQTEILTAIARMVTLGAIASGGALVALASTCRAIGEGAGSTSLMRDAEGTTFALSCSHIAYVAIVAAHLLDAARETLTAAAIAALLATAHAAWRALALLGRAASELDALDRAPTPDARERSHEAQNAS